MHNAKCAIKQGDGINNCELCISNYELKNGVFMAFEFKKCDIEGLYEIQPKIFGDNRGYFLETYSEKDFFEAGRLCQI